MDTFQTRLDSLIDGYVARRVTFAEFQELYSACYIDQEADKDFSSKEIDYYGGVHERAEWTSANPSEEEKSYGWMDEEEFHTWLSSTRESYFKTS